MSTSNLFKLIAASVAVVGALSAHAVVRKPVVTPPVEKPPTIRPIANPPAVVPPGGYVPPTLPVALITTCTSKQASRC